MSLSTISKEEVLGRRLNEFKMRDTLKISDIEGARPNLQGYRYVNK